MVILVLCVFICDSTRTLVLYRSSELRNARMTCHLVWMDNLELGILGLRDLESFPLGTMNKKFFFCVCMMEIIEAEETPQLFW